jgi:hypothetical protein
MFRSYQTILRELSCPAIHVIKAPTWIAGKPCSSKDIIEEVNLSRKKLYENNPLFELIHETDTETSNTVTVQNQSSQQTRQQRKGHTILI